MPQHNQDHDDGHDHDHDHDHGHGHVHGPSCNHDHSAHGGNAHDHGNHGHTHAPANLEDKPALFVADTLDDWTRPQNLENNGILFKRPFHGIWDDFQSDIDAACPRFSKGELTLAARVANTSQEQLSAQLPDCISRILAIAALPQSLSAQITRDACEVGRVVGSLCPFAHELVVKLEIIGDSACLRWHQDNYVGRAIVSYTGSNATLYSRDSNVDFNQLQDSCGDRNKIIRDVDKTE